MIFPSSCQTGSTPSNAKNKILSGDKGRDFPCTQKLRDLQGTSADWLPIQPTLFPFLAKIRFTTIQSWDEVLKLHLIFRLQSRKASRTQALGSYHTELIILEAAFPFTDLTGGPFSRNASPVIQGLAVSTRRCSLLSFFFLSWQLVLMSRLPEALRICFKTNFQSSQSGCAIAIDRLSLPV